MPVILLEMLTVFINVTYFQKILQLKVNKLMKANKMLIKYASVDITIFISKNNFIKQCKQNYIYLYRSDECQCYR